MKKVKKKVALTRSELRSLLQETEYGHISKAQLESVAADLRDIDQLYLRIAILAKSLDATYIPILEQYAVQTGEVDLASIALKYLVVAHNKLEFLPVVRRYIEGVDWDVLDQFKLAAIHVAEYYLREQHDLQLAGLLLDVFDNSDSSILKEASLHALLSFSGHWSDDIAASLRREPEAHGWTDAIEQVRKELQSATKSPMLPPTA